jgi:hypothetical protein
VDHGSSDRPVYVEEAERSLTWEERALVEALLGPALPKLAPHLGQLRVVGRCACGACPSIFMRVPRGEGGERQLASGTGTDDEGGLTGVALWESRGALSLLEFWSVDGHEPCSAPSIATLKRL